MKYIYIIICSFIVASLFNSCHDELLMQPDIDDNMKEAVSQGKASQDSLEIKYSMQSNFELMVIDRIVCKNSTFTLDLSSEEAKDLQIPDEVYQNALKRVDILNQQTTESN